MKKFTNVIVTLNTHSVDEIGKVEVITGDCPGTLDAVTDRTLITFAEVDFKDELKVNPGLKKELYKDPLRFFENHGEGPGVSAIVFHYIDVTDADEVDEEFRKEESMDRRR